MRHAAPGRHLIPYIEFLPRPGQARAVQIDVDAVRIGLRYPVEVGLVGDCRRTLEKLLPLLTRNENRKFLDAAQEGMGKWWELMETRGTRDDKPMKPQVVAWELGKRLADDALVSCGSGTVATWFARQIKARRGQMLSLSGTLASMANGLPYSGSVLDEALRTPGTGGRRGGRRSVRAAHAGEARARSGPSLRGVAGQRGAEPEEDRRDRHRQQGQRDDLTVDTLARTDERLRTVLSHIF